MRIQSVVVNVMAVSMMLLYVVIYVYLKLSGAKLIAKSVTRTKAERSLLLQARFRHLACMPLTSYIRRASSSARRSSSRCPASGRTRWAGSRCSGAYDFLLFLVPVVLMRLRRLQVDGADHHADDTDNQQRHEPTRVHHIQRPLPHAVQGAHRHQRSAYQNILIGNYLKKYSRNSTLHSSVITIRACPKLSLKILHDYCYFVTIAA